MIKTILRILVLAVVGNMFLSNFVFAKSNCFGQYGCFPVPLYSSNRAPYHLKYHNDAVKLLVSKLEKGELKTENGFFTGMIITPETGYKYFFNKNIITHFICGNQHSFFYEETCSNGATDPPYCSIICENGATNHPTCTTCPAGSNMVNGQCTCSNSADVFAQCNSCKSGQVFNNNGQCVDGCSTTNVCGQTIQGFMNNGTCELATGPGVNPNNSCIIDFNVTTNTVNPNGSVEFSWSLANLPKGVSSKCGFVDLTTPTPRPIPGLQNLDPNIDRIRINNVQSTTRFCLVCQYFNLLQNNTLLGEAVKHQWVRVIKVNEN